MEQNDEAKVEEVKKEITVEEEQREKEREI
jgi:hypothetical protein